MVHWAWSPLKPAPCFFQRNGWCAGFNGDHAQCTIHYVSSELGYSPCMYHEETGHCLVDSENTVSMLPRCAVNEPSWPVTGALVASGRMCNPTIWLYPETNDLAVRVSTMMPIARMRKKMNPTLFPHYEGVKDGSSGVEYTNVNPDYYFRGKCNNDPTNCEFVQTTVACDVANIPLQRWVMVTVCLWNRTLDVYINGYLVRSVVLPGPALFDPDALSSIYVGGSGPTDTFGGHFSRLKYYNRAITAQEVMALYKKGPVPAAYWWKTVKHNIEITLDANQDS